MSAGVTCKVSRDTVHVIRLYSDAIGRKIYLERHRIVQKLAPFLRAKLEPTMNRDDEYRRNAAKAKQGARRAETDDERANWLLLAEGWLGLLRKCPQLTRKRSTSRRTSLTSKAAYVER